MSGPANGSFVLALRMALALAFAGAIAGDAGAAIDAAGTAAGSFLNVGAGTSALSMAGATLATGADLAAAAWNPASFARADVLQFSLSHAPLPGGTTQDWLAAGGRLRGGATRWALQALFQREAGLEGRDATNSPTSALSVSDLALGARLARPLTSALAAGVGVQWVHETLAGTNGAGLSFDAGLRGRAGPLGFGFAARNVGGGMNYGDTRYDLPGVIAAGLSWSDEARGLRLDADLESPLHYYRDVRLGCEWLWRDRVALRSGYRLDLGAPEIEALSGVKFGLGAEVGGTWFEYAYTPEGGTGAGQHRIGLTFRPGGAGRAIGDGRNVRDVSAPSASRASASSGPESPAPRARPLTPVPAAMTPTLAGVASAQRIAGSTSHPASIVVAKGETLTAIAHRWHTSVAAIMAANDLADDTVKVGTRLKLPAAAGGSPAR